MNLSEQQVQPKPKLKFTLCGEWTTDGYAFPATQHATVDLRDLISKAIYNAWFTNGRISEFGDISACYIAIGIRRG